MNKIYEFFGMSKPNRMFSNWDSRMETSVGNSNPVYDRYDEKYRLHEKMKKVIDKASTTV